MYDAQVRTQILQIDDPSIHGYGIELYLKREDQTDPVISGNKFRKLKYNLLHAQELGMKSLLTFGGAYSNHLHAVAYAGKQFGFRTMGLVRGERTLPLNPTLRDAQEFGMQIEYISRSEYRNKHTKEFQERIVKNYGHVYIIPEGGSNALAVRGCAEMLGEDEKNYDHVCCPCGTGGTLAGLIAGMQGKQKLWGFPALKDADFLAIDIRGLLSEYTGHTFHNWELITNFHFGGYAKFTSQLIEFINRFKSFHNIQLDPIYTGKMLFGIYELIKNNHFKKGARILAIHTGGQQGIRGFNERFGPLIAIK